MATCKHAKVTAPGLDNVFADDLKLLPLSAFHRLATLLNSIEQGAPWPNSTKHAKASFLSQNPNKTHDARCYRVLAVLPIIRRRWASARLAHLDDWIARRVSNSTFAGVLRKGAEDAWYLTALRLEANHIEAKPTIGGCGRFVEVLRSDTTPTPLRPARHHGFPATHSRCLHPLPRNCPLPPQPRRARRRRTPTRQRHPPGVPVQHAF